MAEGEAGELEEDILDRDVTFAGPIQQAGIGACVRRCGEVDRVGVVVALGRELEVGLHEGPDSAVFGGGTGIHRQRQTGTGGVVIRVPVVLAEVAAPGRLAVNAAVEGSVDAQIAAELDAGIGARNVEEAGAVQRADPYILDRLGLDGKVSGLCRADGEQACRRTENKLSRQLHDDLLSRTTCNRGNPKTPIDNDKDVRLIHLAGGCDFFATPGAGPRSNVPAFAYAMGANSKNILTPLPQQLAPSPP